MDWIQMAQDNINKMYQSTPPTHLL